MPILIAVTLGLVAWAIGYRILVFYRGVPTAASPSELEVESRWIQAHRGSNCFSSEFDGSFISVNASQGTVELGFLHAAKTYQPSEIISCELVETTAEPPERLGVERIVLRVVVADDAPPCYDVTFFERRDAMSTVGGKGKALAERAHWFCAFLQSLIDTSGVQPRVLSPDEAVEVTRFSRLWKAGALSDAEYQAEKARVFAAAPAIS